MGQVGTIADRAMLVGVNIRMLSITKTDKKITEEVARTHNSDVSMGRYAKTLIAKDSVETLRKLQTEIRQEHYRLTLPWAEDGSRILTSEGYFKYAEYMRDAQSRWEPAVDAFVAQWDAFVADAKVKLNGLFNEADYPEAEQVRRKFEFRWSVKPVPVSQDFRVVLGDAETARIKADIEQGLQVTVQDAMKDVWTRMKGVVGKMAERLRAYNPNEPSTAPFRDSLVDNIKELVAILPSLNLTQDPTIAEFTKQMEALTQYDAQTLRDNMFQREDVAARAESILSSMSAFVK